MSTLLELYLDNDYEPKWTVKQNNTSTGAREPATGVAQTARFSATKGGVTINSALTLTCLERAGKPGSYYVIYGGDLLRTYLVSYIGKIIYLIVGDGTRELVQIAHKVVEFRQL